jgi:hypothetical protein
VKVLSNRKSSIFVVLGIIASLLSLMFSAPAAQAAAKVSKKEYQAYMNSMKTLVSPENSILTKYGSVTGDNYTDDETMYEVLTDLVPEMNRFIARVEKIQPKNTTLRSIHKIYISGWNLQFEAVLLTLEALEEQSYAGMAKANKVLSQGRSKMTDFRARLQGLGY